jgi:hypothetical protein
MRSETKGDKKMKHNEKNEFIIRFKKLGLIMISYGVNALILLL